ncbi:MAG: methylated-DNA--[protein]-cysteine S-methyltransferase [bacterium]
MSSTQKSQQYEAAIPSPVGWIGILTDGDHVVDVEFLPRKPATSITPGVLAQLTADALAGYFENGQWPTDLPIAQQGTAFQSRVWAALQRIPAGETKTYGEVAAELGSGPRAVGGACRANSVPLLVPCHRVVAANGDGGFAGQRHGRWMEIKRWLIAHEANGAHLA